MAALALVGLVGLTGYRTLRAYGFKFRWETDPSAEQREPEASREGPIIAGAPVTRSSSPSGPDAEGDSAIIYVEPGVSTTRANVRSSVLVPPAPNDSVSVGIGEFASIDFASFPDGQATCTNCPVGAEWASEGVRFSFRSWTSDSPQPFVLDARNFLPDGAAVHALGPALRGTQGLEVGVLRLDFPGRPRRVAFTIYGPDLISRFDIVAWSRITILDPSAITRTLERRYRPAGRGLFRSERILIEGSDGIDRVSLDGWGPPGHVLILDDLAIDP